MLEEGSVGSHAAIVARALATPARSSSAPSASPSPGRCSAWGCSSAACSPAGAPARPLDAVADTILRNLSLLFVPAAVGVMQQAGLIAANWLAISAALVLSTLLTLVVTVYAFRAVARLVARSARA